LLLLDVDLTLQELLLVAEVVLLVLALKLQLHLLRLLLQCLLMLLLLALLLALLLVLRLANVVFALRVGLVGLRLVRPRVLRRQALLEVLKLVLVE